MSETTILANAFSLNMLNVTTEEEIKIKVKKISLEEAKKILSSGGFISAIGHPSTAAILSQLLGVSVPANRIEVKLQPNQQLIVFQLNVRLPEGKILSESELQQLVQQNKVAFYLVQLSS